LINLIVGESHLPAIEFSSRDHLNKPVCGPLMLAFNYITPDSFSDSEELQVLPRSNDSLETIAVGEGSDVLSNDCPKPGGWSHLVLLFISSSAQVPTVLFSQFLGFVLSFV